MATLTLPKNSEFNDGNLARGTDVRANDQAIATFLNAQNLDQNNIAPGMTPTWTGVHKHSNHLQLISGYDFLLYSDVSTTQTGSWDSATGDLKLYAGGDFSVYSDAGTTLKFAVDGATGSFGIPSGQKFYVDGTALTGNTYIYESASDVMRFVVGGNTDIAFTTTLVSLGAHDISVSPTYKFYLDGASDTYFTESSANTISFFRGGTEQLRMSSGVNNFLAGNVYIAATNALYLDGGGDSYLTESSANNIRAYAGGVHNFSWTASQFFIQSGIDLLISSGQKFYLDGGGDTYIYESSADVMRLVVGGTARLTATTTQVLTDSTVDLAITATKKLYFDGGGDTYDTESSANVLDRYVGGNKMLSCTSSTIAATASSLISMTVNSDTSITLGPTYITIDGDVMSLGVPFMTINADSNTASNQSVTKITGSNSGAGYAAAIDLTDVGTNLDYAFVMPADGTALGAYSGRIPIRVGANTRYIPYYV